MIQENDYSRCWTVNRISFKQRVDRILIGCGDSGTSDGGAGMAEALGVKFLNEDEKEIQIQGGTSLLQVSKIDTSQADSRLRHVQIDVACNWFNQLCGEHGVARVFGPQKGANEAQVIELEKALERYASIIKRYRDRCTSYTRKWCIWRSWCWTASFNWGNASSEIRHYYEVYGSK